MEGKNSQNRRALSYLNLLTLMGKRKNILVKQEEMMRIVLTEIVL